MQKKEKEKINRKFKKPATPSSPHPSTIATNKSPPSPHPHPSYLANPLKKKKKNPVYIKSYL